MSGGARLEGRGAYKHPYGTLGAVPRHRHRASEERHTSRDVPDQGICQLCQAHASCMRARVQLEGGSSAMSGRRAPLQVRAGCLGQPMP